MISKNYLLGITIGLLPFLSATPAKGVTLNLAFSSNPITIGQPLTVDVVVSDLGNFAPPSVSAIDLDILFDPSFLAFNSGTFGNLLGDPNDPTQVITADIISSVNTINLTELSALFASEAQCIDLGGSPAFCSGADPFLDDLQPSSFSLASLTFDTIGLGTSNLSLSINNDGLLDANATPLLPPGIADNQSFTTVSAGETVPEPSFTNIFVLLSLVLSSALKYHKL